MNEEIYGHSLAHGKPTKMSSTFGSYDSSKAVDGDRNSAITGNGCTQTLKQMKNWWQVDLQAVYVIKEVAITNRGDRNGELKCATDTGFDNGVQLKDGMMILK